MVAGQSERRLAFMFKSARKSSIVTRPADHNASPLRPGGDGGPTAAQL